MPSTRSVTYWWAGRRSGRIEEPVELGPGRHPPIHIIAVDELLRNKRATGRHKDLDDVEHLESVRGEPP